jgi:hypothetical protein
MTADECTPQDGENVTDSIVPNNYENTTTACVLTEALGGDFRKDDGRILLQTETGGETVDLSAIYGEQGENPYLEIMVELSPEQARHLGLDLIEQAADRAEE